MLDIDSAEPFVTYDLQTHFPRSNLKMFLRTIIQPLSSARIKL